MRENCPPGQINRLENDLERLAADVQDEGSTEWGLRHIVYERVNC